MRKKILYVRKNRKIKIGLSFGKALDYGEERIAITGPLKGLVGGGGGSQGEDQGDRLKEGFEAALAVRRQAPHTQTNLSQKN